MEAKFTPGPLVVSFESVDPDWAVVTTKGGAVVANVFGQDAANAHLIAAAPELYVAAADALALLDTDFADFPNAGPERAALRAALAKARGEA